MNSECLDELFAKVINKTKSTVSNHFIINASSICITGDIHQDYKATTSFFIRDAKYFHKWHNTINESLISELISSVGVNIKTPLSYSYGCSSAGDTWLIQKALVSNKSIYLPDILHRCFLIGQAFVFFYILGTTDCHKDNFVFSDDSLFWLDSETLLSAYYFKNLKLINQPEDNFFSNNDFNLSELLKTNRREGTSNTEDLSLFNSFIRSLPAEIDNAKILESMHDGIAFGYKCCFNSQSFIFDWILCTDIESTRVIIRATRIYEQIIKFLFDSKNEIERDFRAEKIFKSMYNLGISEEGVLSKLRQISTIEINLLKQGLIPKFRIKDLPLEIKNKYSIAKNVVNRINSTNCSKLIQNINKIINI